MTQVAAPVRLARLLAEQADLRAVERFAHREEVGVVMAGTRYYRDLIPLTSPEPGQQYGFEVDLDACSGCKACVTACNRLNGLDPGESFRSVGTLHGGSSTKPYQQTVTTGCHHCVEPACLSGCPVDAYEKDPVTGIVRHLDDQCIGCGYCTLTCPYEVPRFNDRLGIVRKCDLCADRLAVGEAPACVQACPNGAIRIALVETATLVERARGGVATALVPGGPDSALTVPTTEYRATRGMPDDARSVDLHSVVPSHGHPPLAVMLVLTQLAVGAFVASAIARRVVDGSAAGSQLRTAASVIAVVTGALALAASVLHLGRPRCAWRALIGLRHSWISREILAFSAFATLAAGYAADLLFGSPMPVAWAWGLEALVAVAGIAGVVCSVMIYAVTHRDWWRLRHTGPKFALTTIVCGLSSLVAVATGVAAFERAGAGVIRGLVGPAAVLLVVCVVAKLVVEGLVLAPRRTEEVARTARLLTGDLGEQTVWRMGLALGGVIAGVVAAAAVGTVPTFAAAAGGIGLVATTVGELVERHQFYLAVAARRMPGGLQ